MLIVAVNGRQLDPIPMPDGTSTFLARIKSAKWRERLTRRNLYDSLIAGCATLPLAGVVICVIAVSLKSPVEGIWEVWVYSGGLALVPAVWWVLARLLTEQIRGGKPARRDDD
jgi:hypothetical protein